MTAQPSTCTETAAAAYVRFFETLTPEGADRFAELATPTIRFRDPFNDVTGPAAVIRILRGAFRRLDRPRFGIEAQARDRQYLLLSWTMRWYARNGEVRVLPGMSEIAFAGDGRVERHTDHWDSGQLYARTPLLGPVIRLIGRRLSDD